MIDVNSEMKHKSKTIPEVIKYLVLDSVLYFVAVSERYNKHL